MIISSHISTESRNKNWSFFERRAIIPYRQHSLWKIESGVVKTSTWLEDGTLIVLGIWGPGDIVGKKLTKIQPYQIDCLTEVKAQAIPFNEDHQLTEMLLSHIQQIEELTLIRSYKRVDMMLVKMLNWLAQKFGREIKAGQLIDLRLTHQDIADILGSTRVTVTRVVNQLEQQGLIERLPLHRIVLREGEIWHYEI